MICMFPISTPYLTRTGDGQQHPKKIACMLYKLAWLISVHKVKNWRDASNKIKEDNAEIWQQKC